MVTDLFCDFFAFLACYLPSTTIGFFVYRWSFSCFFVRYAGRFFQGMFTLTLLLKLLDESQFKIIPDIHIVHDASDNIFYWTFSPFTCINFWLLLSLFLHFLHFGYWVKTLHFSSFSILMANYRNCILSTWKELHKVHNSAIYNWRLIYKIKLVLIKTLKSKVKC